MVQPDVAAAADDRIGHIVGGYRFTEAIGAGGMARVFKAESVRSTKIVRAIKLLSPELARTPEMRARFIKEAEFLEALQQTHHPNILRVENVLEDNDDLCIVMEHLEGRTLQAILHEQPGPLPLGPVTASVVQALAGLSHAHALGIVHRDLKPDNIFLTAAGICKLLDFGIAKGAADEALTRAEAFAPATFEYFAPEFASGGAPSVQSDLYSMGVTLFVLLTGRFPYDSKLNDVTQKAMALVNMHQFMPFPAVRGFRPDVPDAFANAVEKATAKRPTDRFGCAAEMADGLLAGAGLEGEDLRAICRTLFEPAALPRAHTAKLGDENIHLRTHELAPTADVPLAVMVAPRPLSQWTKTGVAPSPPRSTSSSISGQTETAADTVLPGRGRIVFIGAACLVLAAGVGIRFAANGQRAKSGQRLSNAVSDPSQVPYPHTLQKPLVPVPIPATADFPSPRSATAPSRVEQESWLEQKARVEIKPPARSRARLHKAHPRTLEQVTSSDSPISPSAKTPDAQPFIEGQPHWERQQGQF